MTAKTLLTGICAGMLALAAASSAVAEESCDQARAQCMSDCGAENRAAGTKKYNCSDLCGIAWNACLRRSGQSRDDSRSESASTAKTSMAQ